MTDNKELKELGVEIYDLQFALNQRAHRLCGFATDCYYSIGDKEDMESATQQARKINELTELLLSKMNQYYLMKGEAHD